jgi:hypothetical protein
MNQQTKDEYTINDNGVTLLFLKNGFLHREAGPAIFWKMNEKYSNLVDEHLYTIKKIELTSEQEEKWKDSEVLVFKDNVFYMLDGRPFPKEEFDLEVKKIQTERMKKELTIELPENQSHTKKTKL